MATENLWCRDSFKMLYQKPCKEMFYVNEHFYVEVAIRILDLISSALRVMMSKSSVNSLLVGNLFRLNISWQYLSVNVPTTSPNSASSLDLIIGLKTSYVLDRFSKLLGSKILSKIFSRSPLIMGSIFVHFLQFNLSLHKSLLLSYIDSPFRVYSLGSFLQSPDYHDHNDKKCYNCYSQDCLVRKEDAIAYSCWFCQSNVIFIRLKSPAITQKIVRYGEIWKFSSSVQTRYLCSGDFVFENKPYVWNWISEPIFNLNNQIKMWFSFNYKSPVFWISFPQTRKCRIVQKFIWSIPRVMNEDSSWIITSNNDWIDIDAVNRIITLNNPEKNSNPRIFKVSSKLIDMLNALPKTSKRVFGDRSMLGRKATLYRSRKLIAKKLQNPRILRIHFHTRRHWKATILYHQTKDVIFVKNFLGHKRIENTLLYIQLAETIFKDTSSQFMSRVAKTVKGARSLIEAGFEYVTDMDGVKIFRKRK